MGVELPLVAPGVTAHRHEDPRTDGRYTSPDYGTNRNYNYGYNRDERVSRRWDNAECWTPRARHYEEVRPGERQDDLDFNRCRRQR